MTIPNFRGAADFSGHPTSSRLHCRQILRCDLHKSLGKVLSFVPNISLPVSLGSILFSIVCNVQDTGLAMECLQSAFRSESDASMGRDASKDFSPIARFCIHVQGDKHSPYSKIKDRL